MSSSREKQSGSFVRFFRRGGLTRTRAALLAMLVVVAAGLHRVSPSWIASQPRLPGADGEAYVASAHRFLETASFEFAPPPLPQSVPSNMTNALVTSPWAMTDDGRFFPKHPIGFSLILLPGVALAGVSGAMFVSLLLSGLLAALLVHEASSIVDARWALLATLAVLLLLPAGRAVSLGVSLETALALGFLAALLAAGAQRSLLAGFVASGLLFLRPTAPILLVFLPLVLAKAGGRRAIGRFAIGVLPGFLLLLASNWWLWGAPWMSSYERTVVATPGGYTLGRHTNLFDGDFLRGVFEIFFSSPSGLVAGAPIVLVGLLGFLASRARRASWIAAVGGGLLAYLSLASYSSRTVRFAFPLLAASVLPLSALVDRLAARWSSREGQ